MYASFPFPLPLLLLPLLHSSSILPLPQMLKKSEKKKKTKRNGVWGTAQEAPTHGRAGPRERPRDATAAPGPSQAVTLLCLVHGPGRDSRFAARPLALGML